MEYFDDIVRTQILRHCAYWLPIFPYFLRTFWLIWMMIGKTAYEGAQTSIYCAVDDEIPKFHGRYFGFVYFFFL